MSVRVQQEDFDVGLEVAGLSNGKAAIGAVASFVGLVRDSNDGSGVLDMTLEHYPGMTESALEDIVAQASSRWSIIDTTVIHRYGHLVPGDQIVLVAVGASHRGEAFAACEFIMDYLKTRAPFWKKETTQDGDRWLEARQTDDAAAQRWLVDRNPPLQSLSPRERDRG